MYVSNYKIIKFVINFTLISVVSILHLLQAKINLSQAKKRAHSQRKHI